MFEAADIANLVDQEFMGNLMSATIEGAGSLVMLAGGTSVPASILTDATQMARILKIAGEAPDKIPTILQLARENDGLIGSGDTVVWGNTTLNVSFVYRQEYNQKLVFIYAVCYQL